MYDLDSTNNAVFSLCYHLITVVKYRKKIFSNGELSKDTMAIFSEVSDEFSVRIVEQECGLDHVHVLFRSRPTLYIPMFVNVLKGRSSKKIREKYVIFLSDKLWERSLWSPSYFLATTGNVTLEVLKEYVRGQRKALV